MILGGYGLIQMGSMWLVGAKLCSRGDFIRIGVGDEKAKEKGERSGKEGGGKEQVRG